MTVFFTGTPSVSDRVLFTNRGPIVKKPLELLGGSDLRIESHVEVVIPSGDFTPAFEGKVISISGSAGGRNDGKFFIQSVRSRTKLVLEDASFSDVDLASTESDLVSLANAARSAWNSHIMLPGVHEVHDVNHLTTAQVAVDLDSAIILLNQIKQKIADHVLALVGVHLVDDPDNVVPDLEAGSIESAIILANGIRRAIDRHRQARRPHLTPDDVSRISVHEVVPTVGTFPGPLTGPFNWVISDPRIGQIADDPSDVAVRVAGLPADVDAVFGMLGAIVLAERPTHGDSVTVDYSFLNNPPVQFGELNTPAYNLNQDGNQGLSGLPSHRYRARATLPTPDVSTPVRSHVKPRRVGWKYKGLERPYAACLNDPNTLLLNVPTNRIAFNGVEAVVHEVVVRYDPSTLPHVATDPWTMEGDGSGVSLAPGGFELVLSRSGGTDVASLPPFFSHSVDLSYPSLTSAAFRARVSSYSTDGVFTGVCFGISDGPRTSLIGFIETEAVNLSSAVALANSLKSRFNLHIARGSSHQAVDLSDSVIMPDASDLPSLVVLTNAVLRAFSSHISKGSDKSIHLTVDTDDTVSSPESNDLASSIALVNELREKFNSHIDSVEYHTQADALNPVPLVKQVGILTNRGYPEFHDSWNSVAADWTESRTYRILRDPNGDVSLYFSGVPEPVASASATDLPPMSSLDGKFDLLQQTFFGVLGRESSSESRWSFVRVDVNPLDSDQIAVNRSVDLPGTGLPELDPASPWITVGQGGHERITGQGLIIDSTSVAASTADELSLGLGSGPYRGFMRLEPTLTSLTTLALEFTGSVGFYTFSVDNVASGVFVDDDQLSTHLVFLQANPTPATVVGQSTEPFSLGPNDVAFVSVNGSDPVPVSFASSPVSAVDVASVFSSAGITGLIASGTGGSLTLQTSTKGASSKISLLGGNALVRLGMVSGTYFGSDSSPEQKVSWFGKSRPDLDNPKWVKSGSQTPSMLGRILRISDTGMSDFLTYSLEDPLITTQIFNSSVDWKATFRLASVSYTPGEPISGLRFCGALLNIDEGPSGRNVELHMSVDAAGSPFVHVTTYDKFIGQIVSVSQIPFVWNDFKIHTVDLFTSKGSGMMIVVGDGSVIGTFPYSSLKPGVFGPSITFGSGSTPVLNVDLRSAQSVFDWGSVAIFRDSRISDPSAPSNRYVGLYRGGDPSVLSSYYLAQVDWTNPHTYRVVRDPTNGVNVYLDGASIPSISVNYDVLSLPLKESSFLQKMSGGRPAVAFGSFNGHEVDRTIWKPFRYSLGRITQTDGIVPPHQVLSHGNVVASPDHLVADREHSHFGFSVYSGGTPTDDFLSDPEARSFTVLGEGTPPVPMTQDMDSRGGLRQNFLPLSSVDPRDFVNQRGFITDFEDDTENSLPYSVSTPTDSAAALVVRANDLIAKYAGHRLRLNSEGDPIHVEVDANPAPPFASNLFDALSSLNALALNFNQHLDSGAHVHSDSLNMVTGFATDLDSGIDLAQELYDKFGAHQSQGSFHAVDDGVNRINIHDPNIPSPTLFWAMKVLNKLAVAFNGHRTEPGVHASDDFIHVAGFLTPIVPTDLTQAINLLNELKDRYNEHIGNVGGVYHPIPDSAHVQIGGNATDFSSLVLGIDRLILNFTAHLGIQPVPRWSPLKLHAVGDTIVPVESNGFVYRCIQAGVSGQVEPNRDTSDGVSVVPSPVLPHSYGVFEALDDSYVNDVVFTFNEPVSQTDVFLFSYRVNGTEVAFRRYTPGFEGTHSVGMAEAGIGPIFINASDSFTLRIDNETNPGSYVDWTGTTLRRKVTPTWSTVLGRTNHDGDAIWECTNLGSRVHQITDAENTDCGVGPLKALLDTAVRFKQSLVMHRTHSLVNGVQTVFHKYELQSVLNYQPPRYNYATLNFDFPSLYGDINFLRQELNEHLANRSHEVVDVVNQSTVPAASSIQSAFDLMVDLSEKFDAHVDGHSWHYQEAGESMDSPSSDAPQHPLTSAVSIANSLLGKYNSHVSRLRSHVRSDDEDLVFLPPASDLPSLLVLVNGLKSKFLAHIADSDVHLAPDGMNAFTASDATDLQTAGDLLNLIVTSYNTHLVQSGVHGSSVFVRLDAPSDTLYRGMKFFQSPVGEEGLVSPFSDDETWHLDGFKSDRTHSIDYPAGAVPEQAVIVGSIAGPFVLSTGDTLDIAVDGHAPATVTFQSTDSTTASVVSRINATSVLFSQLASNHGDGRVRLTSPISTSASDVKVVGGTAMVKLGLDRSQPAKWELLSDDPSSVSTSMLTFSGTDYIRMSSTVPSVYRTKTGLTDAVSSDFDATFSVRVSYGSVTNGDSGVAVGIAGRAGGAFMVAFGFDIVNGVKYVKLTDLGSGRELFRKKFNWGDGAFHKYRISKKSVSSSFDVSIIS